MKKLCAALSLLSMLLITSNCRPPNVTNPHGIYDCTAKAVADHGLSILPRVNDCLSSLNYITCIDALVAPLAGITWEVIACAVRSSGKTFADNSTANPADVISNQAAERARSYIELRGLKFK